jgi:hypothetical protein
MDFNHYNSLRKYYRHYGERAYIADWFNEQPKEEKKMIQRIGLPEELDDFFPV